MSPILFVPSPYPSRKITTTREVADGAARWWRKQIDGSKAPGRDNGAQHEPNNPMNSAFGAMLILSEQLSVPRADDAAHDAFERELADWIANSTEHRELSCDYDPSALLDGLAVKHGISSRAFPWKTRMSIEQTYALVSAGYGAPDVCIAGVQPWLGRFSDESSGTYVSATAFSSDGKVWRLNASPSKSGWSFEGEAVARAAFDVVVKALAHPSVNVAEPRGLHGRPYLDWLDERDRCFAAALVEVQR